MPVEAISALEANWPFVYSTWKLGAEHSNSIESDIFGFLAGSHIDSPLAGVILAAASLNGFASGRNFIGDCPSAEKLLSQINHVHHWLTTVGQMQQAKATKAAYGGADGSGGGTGTGWGPSGEGTRWGPESLDEAVYVDPDKVRVKDLQKVLPILEKGGGAFAK